MPHLNHTTNLWSFVGHLLIAKAWSLEKKIKVIASAGFNGITMRFMSDHRCFADTAGRRYSPAFIMTDDPTEFAVHINVQIDNQDAPSRAHATKHWLASGAKSFVAAIAAASGGQVSLGRRGC